MQADAAEFDFPTEVDAILSTHALTQVPECGAVIARSAAALSHGGRWAVLDLKAPDNAPRWLVQLGIALARPFGSTDEWIARRPWEAIRAAMRYEPGDLSWAELFSGPHSSLPGRATLVVERVEEVVPEGAREPDGWRRAGQDAGRPVRIP